MELIRGIHNIKPRHRGCVLTIGKFDGVHKGHQAVLANLVEKAKALNLPSAVMVFEPQPEELFMPEQAPARLSRLRDKYNALKAQGIDRLLCVNFSTAFAAQSPKEFVQDLLVDRLGVKFLVVGDDFRFGNKRKGDFDYLQSASAEYGFDVVSTTSFRVDDYRISSTAVREALSKGDFDTAHRMLGQSFAISGKVVHGEKNGRTIGFPTANMLLRRHKTPIHGVFAVLVRWQDKCFKGVANLGSRPTLNGQRLQLETHIFDFDKDVYGQRLRIEFIAKIRDEAKFESFEQLKQQIQEDAIQAKECLSTINLNG
ncbi:bifunctional riboflavin kinase/FAD synthetase [Glaciecola sp. XM2]|uniref:bifunctional riboflavin kinase/FAD synthetase n=1 Tax=Glaciecola sp. XM2 TaxID=1914931 RepID=UPI001BDE6878|nr:bifunctional riboflavin kinase/FAD synthetase [Glaciecola sp. XM2]